MLSRRLFILILVSVTALTGCPPKPNKKETLRTGRTRLSPTGTTADGRTTSYSSSNTNTLWGGVTGTDANFNQAVYLFAQPSTNGYPEEDQLGYVSPQPGTNGGIFFWGNVYATQSGQLDSSRSRIHIEIFDSKYGQTRSDGTTTTQLFMHIGPDQEGFIGVDGSPNDLVFSSIHMAIRLQGSFQGDQYVGTMYFANSFTNFEYVPLGQFQVAKSGFFTF